MHAKQRWKKKLGGQNNVTSSRRWVALQRPESALLPWAAQTCVTPPTTRGCLPSSETTPSCLNGSRYHSLWAHVWPLNTGFTAQPWLFHWGSRHSRLMSPEHANPILTTTPYQSQPRGRLAWTHSATHETELTHPQTSSAFRDWVHFQVHIRDLDDSKAVITLPPLLVLRCQPQKFQKFCNTLLALIIHAIFYTNCLCIGKKLDT